MSAIFGLLHLNDEPLSQDSLKHMGAKLSHRGPDGEGLWSDARAGLGHRMLKTTPESLREKLPVTDTRSSITVTADVRLDNRDELAELLNLSGRAKELGDGEFILAAYEAWGERCVERLVGDFAFAVWDARRQTLFCARDHFGVKPFYYYADHDFFAFATEMKALLCLDRVPQRLNELRVADYLSVQFEDKEITFYEDILRLPPGHSLTIRRGAKELRPYWALDPSRELRLGSDDEYAEGFRERFTEAVRCRMRSAFPLGSMLSGGLDSSSITCMARHLNQTGGGPPLHAFSAVFEDVPECDESKYINAVLSQNSIKPHYLRADRVSPLTDLSEVLWHQDEPLWSFNLFLIWCLYKPAKANGVRVVLDGFDGDTTVSHGFDHLVAMAIDGHWLKLMGEIRAYQNTFGLSRWLLYWKYLDEYKVKPLISKSSTLKYGRRTWRGLRRRLHSGGHDESGLGLESVLNTDFVERTGLFERRKALKKRRSNGLPSTEREGHYRNLSWGVMPYVLECLDKTAGAFSIEPRFPFWDKRLVEYCLSLPPEQKIRRGYTRLVLRRAMGGILPEEIRWRADKSNFGPNFNHVLRTYEQARLDEAIIERPDVIEGFFNMPALRDAYSRFKSGQRGDEDVVSIWKALTLSLWLRHTGLAN